MSPNLEVLLAAYQRAGRDGVDAVVDLLDPHVEWIAVEPGRWDCHDREQVLDTFRHQYAHGVRADFGEPIEAGDKRPWRSPATCATCGLDSAQALMVRDYLKLCCLNCYNSGG